MTAFGEYADDDSASTLKQRDYKDATDLAVEAKASWWNGEQTAATLTKQNANGAQRMPDKDNLGAVLQPVPFRKAKRAQSKNDHETWEQDEKTNTLNAFDVGDIRTTQTVVQPIAVDTYNYTTNESTTQTIRSQNDTEHIGAVLTPQAIDFRNQSVSDDVTSTLQSKSNGGYSLNYQPGVLQPTMAIRRLTPTECERLQGFPDGWTKIPYRNKPEEVCPDGPRYKACGNSMAVPVMRWIGKRIEMVEQLMKEVNV